MAAGDGRVHKCLWENKDKISKACRAEEIKIQIMQSSNTELMPNLAKACRAERDAHCKSVRPGKSRVYNCLVTNSDSVRPLPLSFPPFLAVSQKATTICKNTWPQRQNHTRIGFPVCMRSSCSVASGEVQRLASTDIGMGDLWEPI